MSTAVQRIGTRPELTLVQDHPSPPPRLLTVRLAVLFFFVYAAPGAVVPLFSIWLTRLGFSPFMVGIICSTQALGAILAPPLIGQIADRWFPAERCLTICALLSGVLLWIMAELTSPWPVLLASLAFWLCVSPSYTLATSLCFAHQSRPEQGFGRIRLWGTVGWMVPGWLLGVWFSDPEWFGWASRCLGLESRPSELADAFRLAGVFAFFLAAWTLVLPPTPPRADAAARWAPLAAVKLLQQRSILVLWLCAFGVCITFPFSSQVTPLLLDRLGVPHPWLLPTLTLSQAGEVLALTLLPAIQLGLGTRRTLLLGLVSWLAVLVALTVGEPRWLVIASLPFNGLVMSCFIIMGQIYLNGQARGDIRVSAQALLTFVTGLGLATGHVLAGWLRREAGDSFTLTYAPAAVIAAFLVLVFALGFQAASSQKAESSP